MKQLTILFGLIVICHQLCAQTKLKRLVIVEFPKSYITGTSYMLKNAHPDTLFQSEKYQVLRETLIPPDSDASCLTDTASESNILAIFNGNEGDTKEYFKYYVYSPDIYLPGHKGNRILVCIPYKSKLEDCSLSALIETYCWMLQGYVY